MADDPVRAVLFDLGNTLVAYYQARDFRPILRECVEGMCDLLESRNAPAIDRELTFEQANQLNAEDPNNRVRPLDSRLSELFPGHTLSDSDFHLLRRSFLRPIFNRAKLDLTALSTLSAIRERGIRTGIISNTPWGSPADLWLEEVGRHGLSDAVDVVVFCVEVGWRKPAPQIFQHALSLLEIEPRDCYFVGDDPRWDVIGARESGLRPILLNQSGVDSEISCTEIFSLEELLPLLD